MSTLAIVQARMASNRFPGKVMRCIGTTPLIEILLRRLNRSERINKIILATSNDLENQSMIEHVLNLGFEVYVGSENDVLDRYYQAALKFKAKSVVRITGDCPLIDPTLVDQVIERFESDQIDYVENQNPPTYPDGLDTEVFKFAALEMAWMEAESPYDREHVTPYIRKSGKFKLSRVTNKKDFSSERWTVDEPEDFEVIQNIFNYFHPRWDFGWEDVLKLCNDKPEIFQANKHLIRNEGSLLGTGQKLWKRAKRVIPGGNMLLSKRAEMFLPVHWPTYFSKAKGCKVWDLDGKEYIDMSIMGIGTNVLGYGHSIVDEAVRNVVEQGNMSTLNCPEEVYLAEKLIEMHEWADMVRFARSGGEMNSIAIRIARAASGKEKVAICGYHGWHDWYLATNLKDGNELNEHLLPGLNPAGVPSNLKGTVLPFRYNHFEDLQNLVREHNIGVIKMEVQRNEPPKDYFLDKVRKLANEKGIILIFDECTSGFRETFGGLHQKYGVNPDMAIFGKALGNGYAITAAIGKREVMEAAQSTFISSTFWTERIGPSAALKTLEVMEREKSWDKITSVGNKIGKRWEALAAKHNLPIKISGLPALINFIIPVDNWLKYKTLITQEMLKNGYLSTNSVYICTEHSEKIVDQYFNELDHVFLKIAECENGREINELLKGPECHGGFKRLN